MTTSQHKLDANIIKEFAGVPENVSLGSLPEEVFTNDKFDKIKCYKISDLIESQLSYNVVKFYKLMKEADCHLTIPYVALVLGAHLPTLVQNKTHTVFKEYISDISAEDFPDDLKSQIYRTWTKEENNQTKEVVLTNADKQQKIADLIFSKDSTKSGEISISGTSKFACFASAFLMRAITKSSENIINAWAAMKTRFKSFYNEDAPAINAPSVEWINSFKASLSGDPLIGWTWIKMIANAEDGLDVMSPDSGMLRYLATLPLSYSGLHAYKLFLEVKRVSHLNNQWLLQEMVSPMTLPSLIQIATLLKTFEPLTDNKKSGKFKYARIANAAFFQSLQTKNCPELVFLIVNLLNMYVAHGQDHQDPTKIVGLAKVPEEMREHMIEAARKIHMTAPAKNLGQYSQTMASVFLHTKEKERPDPRIQGRGRDRVTADDVFS